MLGRVTLFLALLTSLIGEAAACPRPDDVMRPCAVTSTASRTARAPRVVHEAATRVARAQLATSVVAHPEGCPGRAFCGCGASVRTFGHPVRALYLASAWLRFPRVAPGSGMAAVRPGHVFVLEQHVQGDTWLVYDANSGGHQTRVHHRSIRGYTIVNPRA